MTLRRTKRKSYSRGRDFKYAGPDIENMHAIMKCVHVPRAPAKGGASLFLRYRVPLPNEGAHEESSPAGMAAVSLGRNRPKKASGIDRPARRQYEVATHKTKVFGEGARVWISHVVMRLREAVTTRIRASGRRTKKRRPPCCHGGLSLGRKRPRRAYAAGHAAPQQYPRPGA
jgi:hypothetical protein